MMDLGHAICTYCGDAIETSLHVISDYPKVMKIWMNFMPTELRNTFLGRVVEMD